MYVCCHSNHQALRHYTVNSDFTRLFSHRFSLQFWYRWKEGSNSGINWKFEVDPSKRSQVRAERSWKVERTLGRTFEVCSMAQSRFRPTPDARTCMHNAACKNTIPNRCTSVFSFLFVFLFFSTSFYDCTKLKSTQPLAALCSDSLHSTPSIYNGHRKNIRSTTKVTSRNLV